MIVSKNARGSARRCRGVSWSTRTPIPVQERNQSIEVTTPRQLGATIGKGEPDPAVASFARSEDRVLVTTDRGFLDPELGTGLRVLLVASDDATGEEIARRAGLPARAADDPQDLKRITWI